MAVLARLRFFLQTVKADREGKEIFDNGGAGQDACRRSIWLPRQPAVKFLRPDCFSGRQHKAPVGTIAQLAEGGNGQAIWQAGQSGRSHAVKNRPVSMGCLAGR